MENDLQTNLLGNTSGIISLFESRNAAVTKRNNAPVWNRSKNVVTSHQSTLSSQTTTAKSVNQIQAIKINSDAGPSFSGRPGTYNQRNPHRFTELKLLKKDGEAARKPMRIPKAIEDRTLKNKANVEMKQKHVENLINNFHKPIADGGAVRKTLRIPKAIQDETFKNKPNSGVEKKPVKIFSNHVEKPIVDGQAIRKPLTIPKALEGHTPKTKPHGGVEQKRVEILPSHCVKPIVDGQAVRNPLRIPKALEGRTLQNKPNGGVKQKPLEILPNNFRKPIVDGGAVCKPLRIPKIIEDHILKNKPNGGVEQNPVEIAPNNFEKPNVDGEAVRKPLRIPKAVEDHTHKNKPNDEVEQIPVEILLKNLEEPIVDGQASQENEEVLLENSEGSSNNMSLQRNELHRHKGEVVYGIANEDEFDQHIYETIAECMDLPENGNEAIYENLFDVQYARNIYNSDVMEEKSYDDGYTTAFRMSVGLLFHYAKQDIGLDSKEWVSIWQKLHVVKLMIDISKLSKEKLNLQETLYEMISQQAKHIVKLETLDAFKNSVYEKLGKPNCINGEQFQILFRYVEDIFKIERNFMGTLITYFLSDLWLKHIGCFFDHHVTENEEISLRYARSLKERHEMYNKCKKQVLDDDSHNKGKIWSLLFDVSNVWIHRSLVITEALKKSEKYSPTYIFLKEAEIKLKKLNSLRDSLADEDQNIKDATKEIYIPKEFEGALSENGLRKLEYHCLALAKVRDNGTKKTKCQLYVFNDIFFYTFKEDFDKKRQWVVRGWCSRPELVVRSCNSQYGGWRDPVDIVGGKNFRLTVIFDELKSRNYFTLLQPRAVKTELCSGPAIVKRNCKGRVEGGLLNLIIGDILNVWSCEEDWCCGESFGENREGKGRFKREYIKMITDYDIIEFIQATRQLGSVKKKCYLNATDEDSVC